MVLEYFPILKARLAQQAGTLSGGEQQMLAISRALMLGPRLMLLDEPSFGLAPLIVQEIFRIMRRINAEAKVSMLLVEQNAALALELADHAYVLETGRVVMSGKAVGREERRGHPQILSRLLKDGQRHGAAHPADRLGPRQRRHLCLPGPGAGDDLRLHRPHQFRPGRDGDVQRLPGAGSCCEWGVNFWIALPLVALVLVPDRRRHRARDPAAAAPCAGAVGRGGVHRPAGDLPFAGRRHLGPHHQGVPLAVPEGHASPARATSARIRSA